MKNLFLVILLALLACTTSLSVNAGEQKDYRIAKHENTVDAWDLYLKKHPKGAHVKAAKKAINLLLQERIKNDDEIKKSPSIVPIETWNQLITGVSNKHQPKTVKTEALLQNHSVLSQFVIGIYIASQIITAILMIAIFVITLNEGDVTSIKSNIETTYAGSSIGFGLAFALLPFYPLILPDGPFSLFPVVETKIELFFYIFLIFYISKLLIAVYWMIKEVIIDGLSKSLILISLVFLLLAAIGASWCTTTILRTSRLYNDKIVFDLPVLYAIVYFSLPFFIFSIRFDSGSLKFIGFDDKKLIKYPVLAGILCILPLLLIYFIFS